ncbi:hypothetical protein I4U23_016621 [Adineta vaga]|nr:hypothetical protein I4U23_016621 [Adineta vaga]
MTNNDVLKRFNSDRLEPRSNDKNLFHGNKEIITLIWYDANILSNFEDIALTKNQLRRINDYVLFFNDYQECEEHIKSITTEIVLLVVSGSDAHLLVPKVYKCRQLDSVFIFCVDKLKYEQSLIGEEYSKLVGIFTEQVSLINSIQSTIQLVEKQTTVFNLYNQSQKSIRNLSKETGSFIWHQLLKEVLQKIPNRDNNAKTEMLNKCRLYYRDNTQQLRNIDAFEKTYSGDNAIEWYTKDTFIYKIVNKTLRSEDVQSLYTFRFYLVDLCTQLADNHRYVIDLCDSLKLYRGTKLTKEEILRFQENIGGLISTNGFLSTSTCRLVAEIYAGVRTAVATTTNSATMPNYDLQSIIFEIEYDPMLHASTVAANITYISQFQEEEEYLFDLDAVFEILNVDFDEVKNCWICKMTASNKGLEIAKDYLNFRRNEMNDSNIHVSVLFGDLIHDKGDYDKARQYFQDLLTFNYDTKTKIDIYRGLGRTCLEISQYEDSMNYSQSAYDLCIETDPSAYTKIGKILYFMGMSYDRRACYTTALSYYFKSLEMLNILLDSKLDVAFVLIRIGLAYYRLSKDDLALKYSEEAYPFLQQISVADHYDLSYYYNNMCMIYHHKGNYDQALHFMEKCGEIHMKILPTEHLTHSVRINNMGECYYKKGEYKMALKLFNESLNMARVVLKCDDNYRSMGMRINNIGKCFYRQGNLAEALKHYEFVLQLIRKANLTEHVDLAYTLKNFGEVYCDLLNFDLSLDYFNQSLEMYQCIYKSRQHSDVAKCLNLIGQVYYRKNSDDDDDSVCYNFYVEALNIWTNVLPSDHPNIALCYKNIGLYYLMKRSKFVDAEKYFTLSHNIYQQTLSSDHPLVTEFDIQMQMISKCRMQLMLVNILYSLKFLFFMFLFSISCWFS